MRLIDILFPEWETALCIIAFMLGWMLADLQSKKIKSILKEKNGTTIK